MKGKLFNKITGHSKNIEFGNIKGLYEEMGDIGAIPYCFNEVWITKNTLRILNKDEFFAPGEPMNLYFKLSVFDKKGSLIRFYDVNIRNSKGNPFK